MNNKEIYLYATEFQSTFHMVLRRYMKIPEADFFLVCGEELELLKTLSKKISGREISYSKTASEVMVMLYQEMKKLVLLSGESRVTVAIGQNIQKTAPRSRNWQDRVIDFIAANINRELKSSIRHAFLHGSFATADYLAEWSDLDILIFLKEEVFVSAKSLIEFKKKIRKLGLLVYKIDPLAHHEFMFFTAFDQSHYPNFLFPAGLFSYARDLLGQKNITLLPRPEIHERIAPVVKIIQFFRTKILEKRVSQDDFSWKNDLSLMMLFPVLLLEAAGEEVYKKFSFGRAKARFPNVDFEPIDEATQIRSQWRRTNLLRYVPSFFFTALPDRLIRKMIGLHRRLFSGRRPNRTECQKRNNLYESFLVTAETSLELLLNHENW